MATKKNNTTLSYQSAKAELEAIVNKLKNGTADIDSLSVEMKRANELLAFCLERLRQVEEELKFNEQ
ncbi:MAG: exodeoxyribonuclease VII small subunit [Bacteroidales bacterium]|nr:exodeoxyribonuclease VII small subunit [Bacteroidales bacterium]MCL2132906.1 exodeoxyribonuclease VII small subunit [Bacteroidales bacterium]